MKNLQNFQKLAKIADIPEEKILHICNSLDDICTFKLDDAQSDLFNHLFYSRSKHYLEVKDLEYRLEQYCDMEIAYNCFLTLDWDFFLKRKIDINYENYESKYSFIDYNDYNEYFVHNDVVICNNSIVYNNIVIDIDKLHNILHSGFLYNLKKEAEVSFRQKINSYISEKCPEHKEVLDKYFYFKKPSDVFDNYIPLSLYPDEKEKNEKFDQYIDYIFEGYDNFLNLIIVLPIDKIKEFRHLTLIDFYNRLLEVMDESNDLI